MAHIQTGAYPAVALVGEPSVSSTKKPAPTAADPKGKGKAAPASVAKKEDSKDSTQEKKEVFPFFPFPFLLCLSSISLLFV